MASPLSFTELLEHRLRGFLPGEIDLFEQEQARFAWRDQIHVPVTIDIHGNDLDAASGFRAVIDNMFDEMPVFRGPTVPIKTERFKGPRVAAISEVPFAG